MKGEPGNYDSMIDFARPWIANAIGVPAGVAAGTASAPFAGPGAPAIGLAAETQAYALTDSLMQYLKTKQPDSYKEALGTGEMNAAVNAIGGKIINSVFKGAKGVYNSALPEIYKLAPKTSAVLENYGMNALSKVSGFLEDLAGPSVNANALDRVSSKGFTQSLALANSLDKRMAGTNSDPAKLAAKIKDALMDGVDSEVQPQFGTSGIQSKLHYVSKEASDLMEGGQKTFSKIDEVLGDTEKLKKVLNVGSLTGSSAVNVKQDLQAYQFMKLVNDATTKDLKGNMRIDSNKIGEAWTNPENQENYNLLFGKATKDRISEFFKTLSTAQGSPPANANFLKYAGRGNFLLGLGNIVHGLAMDNTTQAVMGGGQIGVQLTASMIGRLLSKEGTGKILMEIVEGAKSSVPPAFKARVLTNALQGFSASMVGSNGQSVPGSFQEDKETGATKFVPDK
jgi:hypothetical protein